MSLSLGLPTRGSDVTIVIHRIHLHPLNALVEFWAKFGSERAEEYECLAVDIQCSGSIFQEFEGCPGDQCLVQVDGIWNRARIVSRNGSNYSVFLIDKGVTLSTTTGELAWGKKEHFQLPPEVEFCVLANVLPHSTKNTWSPGAFEYLRSLSGGSLKAHVQDVLVHQRIIILHIPCISKQMYDMQFAKKLSPDMFKEFMVTSLQSNSDIQVSPKTQQISTGAGVQLRTENLFMVPELQEGTVETVIVTEVSHPRRFFCQLKVFSHALMKLSQTITQCSEGSLTNFTVSPDMINSPCAAKGRDGRWHRSVLQQVFPTNGVVEVFNIDYGTRQFVQVENVKPLASEFLRMPVVTYICSLHGIIDRGLGWTSSQIDLLRNLLLHKTMKAKFEYQSVSEGVYYVTLFGDGNTNINKLFGSEESCLLEYEKTDADYATCNLASSYDYQELLTSLKPTMEKQGKGSSEKIPAQDLSLSSSHLAVVQHVVNPSEFWIQTQNYATELDELMDKLSFLYKNSENKDVVKDPFVGLCCAAKANDGNFYRATVSAVGVSQIKVYFVDYGNTEVVKRSDIRTLPYELRNVPRLALRCTLANVRPKDGTWSQNASGFFVRAVKDKSFVAHVTAKDDNGYVVRLTDPNDLEEQDLSTHMWIFNLAEKADKQRQPKTKLTTQPATLPITQQPLDQLASACGNKVDSPRTKVTFGHAINKRVPTFKENRFPIGSVLDVSVSCIKSPNDFWCQLVHTTGHLKCLMHNMQAHYASSEFQPLTETACVARHADNGMWYRAMIIHKFETPHVEVLFVDYGQREVISLYDVRSIRPEFLTLQGQAFRCSLLNPLDPSSTITQWNEEAVARFQNFVMTAASNFVILKCTIYAVIYSEQRTLFNIVDLETPFESVCTSMVNLVKSAPPKRDTGQSFHLKSYYYSTHNVKRGTEEKIIVTYVDSVNQFYCQLERNTDVMEDLKSKVSSLCQKIENLKLPKICGTLCFAKYTDGQWYRGQIKATKPAILVHFVDYGDTVEVDKSDILPVPREANDIMSVPVQALVCSLSDVPANVTKEVNRWFETSATESKFHAVVVGREADGKLLVELYQGNAQINSKIKKIFQIEMHPEQHVVHQKAGDRKPWQKPQQYGPEQPTKRDDHTETISKGRFSAPNAAHQIGDEIKPSNMNQRPSRKPLSHIYENGQRVKTGNLELYRPPHQRQSCGTTSSNTGNGPKAADTHVLPSQENVPSDTGHQNLFKTSGTDSMKESRIEKLPKLADLPTKTITSGMEAEVYVSHYNNPLSFYIQLVSDENDIFSVVEKLNDSTPRTCNITDVNLGDLVQAEFADDSSWYRAVIKEIQSNASALVEFIDFGNTALTPISKMGRLPTSSLQVPRYSIPCMLSKDADCGKEKIHDPEVLSDKKLRCRFIRQLGSVQEVSLEDSGVKVLLNVHASISADAAVITQEKRLEEPGQTSEKPSLNPSPLHYNPREFFKKQLVQSYISTINNADSFWCQSADTEELDKITSVLSEVGKAVHLKPIDPDSLTAGSPCIALFSDDGLWYRAEVINKDGEEVSVLFVDYGNESQVNITDVRQISPDLAETPPLAFLCKLEGFDPSCGFWETGALDKLFTLTTDKLLELTVTRVTRDAENTNYCVQMECDGQIINEAMKTWWKSFTDENKVDAGEQCDSSLEETALPEDQAEYPKSLETVKDEEKDVCIYPQSDHSGEHLTDKCGESHKADVVTQESKKTSEAPEYAEQVDSSAESPSVETYQKTHEAIDEEVGAEKSSSPILMTNPKNILPCDSGIEEIMVPAFADKDFLISHFEETVFGTDKCPEEEAANVTDNTGPEDENPPLYENLKDVMSGSKIPLMTESSSEDVNSFNVGDGLDSLIHFDERNDGNDSKIIPVQKDISPSTMSAVQMVPREVVYLRGSSEQPEMIDLISDFEQIQTELLLPSLLLSAPLSDAPKAQDIVAESDVKEVQCLATPTEVGLVTEDEPFVLNEDIYSALHDDSVSANIEPQIDTVSLPVEMVEEDEDVACSTDVHRDLNEPDGDGTVSNEEKDHIHMEEDSMTDEISDLHDGKLPALSLDTKPESECQESNLVEELTGCFEGYSLTDISKDQQQQAEPEDCEQLEDLPLGQIEGFEASQPPEEASSTAADDIKELQPSQAASIAGHH